MSNAEVGVAVLQLLVSRTEPICDACIERQLGYPFKTVNPVNNRFKREGVVIRGRGRCPVCDKSKLVNQRP